MFTITSLLLAWLEASYYLDKEVIQARNCRQDWIFQDLNQSANFDGSLFISLLPQFLFTALKSSFKPIIPILNHFLGGLYFKQQAHFMQMIVTFG